MFELSDEKIAKSRFVFQNSLKASIDNIKQESTQGIFSFFANKKINYDSCDNCGECVQFCPTDALFYTHDKTKILFSPLRCVACGVCDHICHVSAFENDDSFDTVVLAFGKAEVLIDNHFAVCKECRVSFPQKGNEKICKRCVDFANNHSSLFTLARDVK